MASISKVCYREFVLSLNDQLLYFLMYYDEFFTRAIENLAIDL